MSDKPLEDVLIESVPCLSDVTPHSRIVSAPKQYNSLNAAVSISEHVSSSVVGRGAVVGNFNVKDQKGSMVCCLVVDGHFL